MKIFTKMVLLFFITSLSLSGQEKYTQSIYKLIQKIKHSSSDDRRVAVNQLKNLLRTKNKETQKKVMLELQRSLMRTPQRKYQTHTDLGTKNKGEHHTGLHLPHKANNNGAKHQNTPLRTSPQSTIHTPRSQSPIRMISPIRIMQGAHK